MNDDLTLFLPCASGVQELLAREVHAITGAEGADLLVGQAGVLVRAGLREAMALNLYSRIAQRVLIELAHAPYGHEGDLYDMARTIAWEDWFGPTQTFKIEATARHSPLRSLNFAALRVKDAVADRFRQVCGQRPSVDTHAAEVRIHLHLDAEAATISIDTSGQALFKRGWRLDAGDAPLKETLAAAMLMASGWADAPQRPLYDPCCGSGTIAIEAAQIARRIAPGGQRSFGFERLAPFDMRQWQQLRQAAQDAVLPRCDVPIFGSDIAHRMADFARRNAERAQVGADVQFRGGDALERLPPCDEAGVLMLNPPYGERIAAAGAAGRSWRESGGDQRRLSAPMFERNGSRRAASGPDAFCGRLVQKSISAEVGPAGDGQRSGGEFFARLAGHWKRHFAGWTAWVLAPLEVDLPAQLRLKPARRVPMFNGPIECRLMRFDLMAGSARKSKNSAQDNSEKNPENNPKNSPKSPD